jgi:hypothetical protein
MSDLLSLKTEISQLSDEELKDLLMGIRQNRRTVKPKADATTKKSSVTKKETSTETLLSGIDKNMAAALLAALGRK